MVSGSWSSGSALGVTAYQSICGGNSSSAIATALSGSGAVSSTTKIFDGTSWTTGATLTTGRSRGQSGDCGSPSSMIVASGYTGPSGGATIVTNVFNGLSWETVASVGTARQVHTTCGSGSGATSVGGLNSSSSTYIIQPEMYNGTSWSYIPNFTSTGFQSGTSGGNGVSDVIVMGGFYLTYLTTAKIFNGTSWELCANINTARSELGGGGNSSHGVCFGGKNTSGAVTSRTEEFNGSVWTNGGDLLVAKRLVSGGAKISGTSLSGICIGGYTTAAVATTENYSQFIYPGTIRSSASNRIECIARSKRVSLSTLGEPTLLTIPTYTGGGQCTHPSVIYIEDGFAGYKYWMGMTPYPNGNDDYENPSLVASNDGINWEVPSGITNPLAPKPSHHNSDVCLAWDETNRILYLYYIEMLTDITHTMYRFPITENPLTVGTKVQCLQDSSYLLSPAIIKEGENNWILWIFRGNTLYRYFSLDGKTWTNDVPVGIYGPSGERIYKTLTPWHLSVSKFNDKYLMLACAFPVGSSSAYTDLYYAIVDDKYSALDFNPVAILTEFAGWGEREVYQSCLVHMENGTYRIYISAATSLSVWRIGYADAINL